MYLFKIYQQFVIARIILWFCIALTLIFVFLVISPFRNDTPKYLEIKRTTWLSLSSNQNTDAVKSTLNKANKDLQSIRCDKVEDQYHGECNRLKSDISEIITIVDSNDTSNSARTRALGMEIASILKN